MTILLFHRKQDIRETWSARWNHWSKARGEYFLQECSAAAHGCPPFLPHHLHPGTCGLLGLPIQGWSSVKYWPRHIINPLVQFHPWKDIITDSKPLVFAPDCLTGWRLSDYLIMNTFHKLTILTEMDVIVTEDDSQKLSCPYTGWLIWFVAIVRLVCYSIFIPDKTDLTDEKLETAEFTRRFTEGTEIDLQNKSLGKVSW